MDGSRALKRKGSFDSKGFRHWQKYGVNSKVEKVGPNYCGTISTMQVHCTWFCKCLNALTSSNYVSKSYGSILIFCSIIWVTDGLGLPI